MSDNPIFDNVNRDKETPIYADAEQRERDKIARSSSYGLEAQTFDPPIEFPNEPNESDKPSMKPRPKVLAATAGAGVGSAAGEILTWIIEATAQIDIPANVELAIGVVLTAGFAFLSGWFKKD